MTGNGRARRLRAVLFDAGNTLLFLDYARLAQAVSTALNLPLTEAALTRQISRAAHAMEDASGSDQDRAALYLETLFVHAGVPSSRLPEVRECLARLHRERHLWSSVAPSVAESLSRLRNQGLVLGVVSNSDGRVEEALEAAGLRSFFDVVVESALIGVEKPDPRIFQAALQRLGVAPEEAVYVGDLYSVDILGARAAGMDAVLLGNPGDTQVDCRRAQSIEELVQQLLSGDLGMKHVSESDT